MDLEPWEDRLEEMTRQAVSRHVYGDSRLNREQLREDVCTDIWTRLPLILARFLVRCQEKGLVVSDAEFEKFLRVCIKNALTDAIRKIKTGPVPVDGVEPTVVDPATDQDAAELRMRWTQDALDGLSDVQRVILPRRLVDEEKTAKIAEDLDMKPAHVSNHIYRGKLAFRNKVIESAALRCLESRGGDGTGMDYLIRNRCRKDHACHLYRIDCKRARDLPELGQLLLQAIQELARGGESGNSSGVGSLIELLLRGNAPDGGKLPDLITELLTEQFDRLRDFILECLWNWDLAESRRAEVVLDRCRWA